ncbi:PTS mannose transporter subunit IIA [Vagococcus sp. BWB3-3]|uniref:PTS mannose transporter subunit IIA n=1 Tax=Vagococcus allomyrinae TaxID=2794353 RepID=A0A940PGN4_9ENTE|nr:PTS mannose transporter subunit IIA [Vagococcus allomyrinae]MBP1042548.1 PTS mannose transporter subunit IIA [Vagococcus allomyrinae]
MYRIVIVSHGGLANELMKSAEMIAGKQEKIECVSLNVAHCLDAFQSEVEDRLKENVPGEELLVLTDIMYGTPFNNVCTLMAKYHFEHFTGVNLPILLECLMSRKSERLEQVVKRLAVEGQTTFVYVNDLLKKGE